MAGFPLSRLLRSFYRWRLPYIPVVEGADAGGKLVGFLSREKLNRELSDLERFHRDFEAIPDSVLLKSRPDQEILVIISRSESIPVLLLNGEEAGFWDSPTFLRNAASFKNVTPVTEKKEIVPEVDGQTWLSEMLLEALPWPMYASDLNGNALFFNTAFEKDILPREGLKNSMRLAEAFLKEAVRDILAKHMNEKGPASSVLASIPPLGIIRILNLQRQGSIKGYLLIFHDWGADLRDQSSSLLHSGKDLDTIIEGVEAEIIYSTLLKEGRNISHAAHALRIRRSTLQNKIKRLNIEDRFERAKEGPIKRFRRTKEELERQKKAPTESAMGGLIQGIMEDARQSLKGKKKAPGKPSSVKKSADRKKVIKSKNKKKTSK